MSHIGMICTYYTHDGKGPYAAICTNVREDGSIDLHVFTPQGTDQISVPAKSSADSHYWEEVSKPSIFSPTPAHKPAAKPKK